MCQTVRVGRGTRRLRTHGTGPAGATGPCPLLPDVYLAPGSGAGTAWGTKVARKLGKAETRHCGTEFAGPRRDRGLAGGAWGLRPWETRQRWGGLAGQPASGFWDHGASAVQRTEKRRPRHVAGGDRCGVRAGAAGRSVDLQFPGCRGSPGEAAAWGSRAGRI